MNFFGHAAVAARYRADGRFVLGAMLPDFASMIRTGVRRAHDRDLSAGIAMHHATDDAFHHAAPFVRLCSDAGRELRAAGLGRGSARAVAHVGTELLLDGQLVTRPSARQAYARALETAGQAPVAAAIEWCHPGVAERFEVLCARLHAHGPPSHYADPDEVGRRLEHVLADRPRLAIEPRLAGAVVRWLGNHSARVAAAAEPLLDEVHARLAGPG